MRTKAYRRHQEKRSKLRAERFIKKVANIWGYSNNEKLIHTFATDRCPCSCPMCGNQRKHWGQTWKEDLADIDFKEQINADS